MTPVGPASLPVIRFLVNAYLFGHKGQYFESVYRRVSISQCRKCNPALVVPDRAPDKLALPTYLSSSFRVRERLENLERCGLPFRYRYWRCGLCRFSSRETLPVSSQAKWTVLMKLHLTRTGEDAGGTLPEKKPVGQALHHHIVRDHRQVKSRRCIQRCRHSWMALHTLPHSGMATRPCVMKRNAREEAAIPTISVPETP